MIRRAALALLLVLCLAVPLRAEPDPTLNYSLAANVQRQVLPNGLILLVKEDHTSNVVALDVAMRAGQSEEDSTNSGITSLMGRALQRRVTQSATGDDNLVEMTGSVMRYNVTPDFTELSVETTSAHAHELFQRVLSSYAERSFKPEELDYVRTQMVHEMEGEQRVFSAIYDIFLQSFYRYHPYREPQEGNVNAIRGLTLKAFNQFYDRYCVPNRTIMAVVGDVNAADVAQQVSAALGNLQPGTGTDADIPWSPVGSEKELQLSAGSNLAWIFLGYPAPSVKSQDYPAMRVMHAIMGEGVSSRLWMDLREQNGLAYEVGSMYPMLSGPAHFLSYIITTPPTMRKARQGMFTEMDRLKQQDVPEQELEQGRWKVIGSVLLQQETAVGKASMLATSEAQGVGYQFSDRFLAAVRKVTSADIRAVANKYLDNYTLIVAHPPGVY